MNRFIKVFCLFVITLAFFLTSSSVKIYAEGQTNCAGRYVTLVNPVRGRELWLDKTLKPITDQYSASAKYNFPTTWLLQYDALTDEELINEVKSFEVSGEKGIFLEISKSLADESGVVYTQGLKWSDPGVIFLSAYSQSERRVLIDTLFNQFKKDFGYYPKSVGAWWIDSYSLNYIENKYGLEAIMIVADQKTTDSYGVWGQWWGYPYYPSKRNVLVPAVGDSLNAVVIQWAQRDPVLAYGEGSKYSNFSLQANDYIRSGKNTGYFKNLVNSYLDCQNSVGQVTVGLETGMESIAFNEEYSNQLEVLSGYKNLKAVTMSDFAKDYESINKENPQKIIFGSWNLTPTQRENITLGDFVVYNHNISFSDYFVADKSSFLDRNLPVAGPENPANIFPWFLTVPFIFGIIALWRHKVVVWICSFFFVVASFGLVLRSTVMYGWQVFYGPVIKQIVFAQWLIVLVVFTLFFLFFVKAKVKFKNINLLMWLLPLSFGLDRIVSAFRYSVIEGNPVIGFSIDRIRIIGLMLSKNGLELLDKNYSVVQALSFLKFPIDEVWQNAPIYFVLYPLIHILIATALYFLLIRTPKWVKITLLSLLVVFFVMQIVWIFGVDPKIVLAVIN